MEVSCHHAARICAIALGLALCATDLGASETEAEVDNGPPEPEQIPDQGKPSGANLLLDVVVGHQDGAVDVEAFPLDLYMPPRRKEMVAPVYPRLSLQEAREGWVRLEFMVDTQGNAYEISVSRSMGDRLFEAAAIRALKKSTFEPALIDGQPADAGASQQYVFALEGGSKGAGAWFVRTYKAAMRVIGEGDREKADKYLASLEERTKLNLYEDAYLHVAKYNYYAKWGDKRQQLLALDRAVAHEFAERNLPEELFANCQRARFMLLVETRDYERAVRTYYQLRGLDLEVAVMEALQTVVDKLEVLRADDRGYTVRGDFGKQTSWSYNLFKDEFSIGDVQGEIAEIKLRCWTGYVFFRFQPDVKYQVAGGRNRCHLELVGNPGTTFALTQS